MTRFSQTLFVILGSLALGCEPGGGSQTTDSQTNWLRSCQIDAQCGTGLSCLCGVCTTTCVEDAACIDLPGAECVAASEPGAIARCDGSAPASAGLCLPRCEDTSCPEGQMCVASVCEPVPQPKVRVVVDSEVERQELIGFGASIAYGEAEISNHPRGAALHEAAFLNLGLDILRLRNRIGHPGDDDLTETRALLDIATANLGREPTILLSSWSPPPALKANGSVDCQGNPGTCTLVKTAAGVYDYAGLAAFWRDSLDAYAALRIIPSYIGIQNNVNWVPTAQEVGEACRFLPVEGSTTVRINGVDVQISYPGYAEALEATLDALEGLSSIPKILAPETSGFEAVSDYTPDLDFSKVDALAHHLYGADPEAIDMTALAALGDFGAEFGRPILQTEMQADGYTTALLINHTLEVEGGSAYVLTTLTGSATGPTANRQAPIGLGPNDFVLQDTYYTLQHYAVHTDPGWVRKKSESSLSTVLSTAWRSPDQSALTVVLVNTGNTSLDVELVFEGAYATSEVRRTVFAGVERFASHGALPRERILSLPARSVATIALEN